MITTVKSLLDRIKEYCRSGSIALIGIMLFCITFTLFGSDFVRLVHASFGSWGDTSLINACVDGRGKPTVVGAGGSCNSDETQTTWLKDVDAGTGLSISRSSSGVTLSLSSDTNAAWMPANETWTYSSADGPTFTATVSGDVNSRYTPGMRIKLTQSAITKYFLLTAVSYASGTSTLTMYGGTDYTLANVSISNQYYSLAKAPQGFPLNPTKWTERVTSTNDAVQSSPSTGTWYNNDTSLNLTVPIGVWNFRYMVHLYYSGTPSSSDVFNMTASTANNSQTDADLTSTYEDNVAQTGRMLLSKQKTLNVTSKTTYYINTSLNFGSASGMGIAGDRNSTNVVEAVSAYL